MLKKFVRVLALCLLLSWTTACANLRATECSWTETISVSKDDHLTDETKKEILSYDLARQKNCPKPSK